MVQRIEIKSAKATTNSSLRRLSLIVAKKRRPTPMGRRLPPKYFYLAATNQWWEQVGEAALKLLRIAGILKAICVHIERVGGGNFRSGFVGFEADGCDV